MNLVGFTQISFCKDNYFFLCEYLFHSVYDSESLEDFDLKQYLNVQSEELSNSGASSLKSILKQQKKSHLTLLASLNIDYSNSSFVGYYLNYLDAKLKDKHTFSASYLDDKLSKAFRLISLPTDWTVLGQQCYLSKCKYLIHSSDDTTSRSFKFVQSQYTVVWP